MEMRTGQCFILYGEGTREGYFFTGIKERENGQTMLVMCKMLPEDKITMDAFLKIEEQEYRAKVNDGSIEEF